MHCQHYCFELKDLQCNVARIFKQLEEEEEVCQVTNCSSIHMNYNRRHPKISTYRSFPSAIRSHWPSKSTLDDQLRPYFKICSELSKMEGLQGDRINLPSTLTATVIVLAHGAHPGMVRGNQHLCHYFSPFPYLQDHGSNRK